MATVTSAYKPPKLSKDALFHAYRVMYLARKIDDKEIQLKRQNHTYFQINGVGHEAIQVATAMHLKAGVDWFYPYYRDRAFCLQLGMSSLDILMGSVGPKTIPIQGTADAFPLELKTSPHCFWLQRYRNAGLAGGRRGRGYSVLFPHPGSRRTGLQFPCG